MLWDNPKERILDFDRPTVSFGEKHSARKGGFGSKDEYGDLPWNPHLHTGHAAASLTTGTVRLLSEDGAGAKQETRGSAAVQGAQGVRRGKDAKPAPRTNWEKLRGNVARAAEKGKVPWYEHGSHMTPEKLAKARKVIATTLLAAPLAIPLGAASGLAVEKAVTTLPVLAAGAARGAGKLARAAGGKGAIAGAARTGNARLNDWITRNPGKASAIEGIVDGLGPLPPVTGRGMVIAIAKEAKARWDARERPQED